MGDFIKPIKPLLYKVQTYLKIINVVKISLQDYDNITKRTTHHVYMASSPY
ncbi:hypothetical protein ACVNP1_04235 [Staphylococcus aureus]